MPKLAHMLPVHEKVELLYFDTTGQPKKDFDVLFQHYCRMLGKDFRRFPIDPIDLRKVRDNHKKEAWEIMMIISILKYYHYFKLFFVIFINL